MEAKLDVKDRRLLMALDEDAAQPLGPIARNIGLSKEAVAYRLRRLEREGIIANYITLSHFAKTGMTHYKLYITYANISKEEREEIITHLQKVEGIGWIASTEGRYDLMVSIRCRTIFEFERFKDAFCSRFDKRFQDIAFAVLTEAETKPRYYLLPEAGQDPRLFLHCDDAAPMEMDEEDWKVLHAINTAARTPAHDLSAATGLSERVIRYRRKDLEQKGIIVGYKLALDYRKFGYLFFKCFVTFRGRSEESYRELRTYLRMHPNVIYWIKTLGSWDAEVEIEAPDVESFYRIITELKDRFAPIIARVDATLVSKEHAIAHA